MKRFRSNKKKKRHKKPAHQWARRGIVLFSIIWLGLFIIYIANSPKKLPEQKTQIAHTVTKPAALPKPTVASKVTAPLRATLPSRVPTPIAMPDMPLLAIVIDDIGHQWQSAQRILALPEYMTLAILPYSPFGQKVAQLATEYGKEVILHAPMEPQHSTSWDGGLSVDMDQTEITDTLNAMLDWLPEANGVNNHMGSLFTTETASMTPVLDVIKKRDLYFLDSRTSAQSQGIKMARALSIPSTQRDIFLDNERDVARIQTQLEALVQIALTRGYAIGIGHPYPETIEVLENLLPLYQDQLQFVTLSELIDTAIR